MLTLAAVSDMFQSFVWQVRRSPWTAALLLVSLVVASGALVVGFGLSDGLQEALTTTLPGDLAALYFYDASRSATAQDSAARDLFTVDRLTGLIQSGRVSGYFFQVRGKPVLVRGKRIEVTMIVYGGRVPLYDSTAQETLAHAEEDSGLAVNAAFLSEAAGRTWIEGEACPGWSVYLQPDVSLPVCGRVGPPASVEPSPTILISGQYVPRLMHSVVVGLYLPSGQDPAVLCAALNDDERENGLGVEVTYTPASEQFAPRMAETRLVSRLVSTAALAVAVVAFVNAATLLMLWSMVRAPGLGLRRALGAGPLAVGLYALADVVLLTLLSILLGVGIGLLVGGRLPVTSGLPVVAKAATVMAAGASVAAAFLLRSLRRADPGLLLKRGI